MKKILVVVPYNSAFRFPLINGLNELGFEVEEYDYRYLKGNINFSFFSLYPLISIFLLISKKILKKNYVSYQNKSINNLLIKKIKRIRPEYLFVVKGETLDPKIVDQIKKMGVKTILWQVDPSFHPKIWSWFKIIGPHYDVVLIPEEGTINRIKAQKWGNLVLPMLAAADLKEKIGKLPKIYDVVFVGTYNPDRERF